MISSSAIIRSMYRAPSAVRKSATFTRDGGRSLTRKPWALLAAVTCLWGCPVVSIPLMDGGMENVDAGDAGPDAGDAGIQFDAGWYDGGSFSCPGPGDGSLSAASGTITTLASGLDNPWGLAIQGQTLYWTNSDDPGAIMSIDLEGGAPITLIGQRHTPSNIVTDAQHLYWIDFGTFTAENPHPYNDDGAIIQADLDGSNVITIASNQPAPYSLTVNAGTIYWVNGGIYNTETHLYDQGAVLSAPVGENIVSTLFVRTDDPYAVAVDDANIYWASLGNDNINALNGRICQASIGGNTVTTLAVNQGAPVALAVDQDNVYWANDGSITLYGPEPCGGSIVQVEKGGGSLVTLVTGQNLPSFVAVDNTGVYWTNSAVFGGAIVRSPLGGGLATTLVSGGVELEGIIATEASLFWADYGSNGSNVGTINSFAEPGGSF